MADVFGAAGTVTDVGAIANAHLTPLVLFMNFWAVVNIVVLHKDFRFMTVISSSSIILCCLCFDFIYFVSC